MAHFSNSDRIRIDLNPDPDPAFNHTPYPDLDPSKKGTGTILEKLSTFSSIIYRIPARIVRLHCTILLINKF
jgi:hypothetical protein